MFGEFHPLMIFPGAAFLAWVYQGNLMVWSCTEVTTKKLKFSLVQGKLLNLAHGLCVFCISL